MHLPRNPEVWIISPSLFQSNRSQPAIGLKQTPKARVSPLYITYTYIYIYIPWFILSFVTLLRKGLFHGKESVYCSVIDCFPFSSSVCSKDTSLYLADSQSQWTAFSYIE